MLNTIKTTLGFIKATLHKYRLVNLSGSGIKDIYNYRLINENLCTSGQPTEKQFLAIKASGYKTVINLAPSNAIENSLKNECEVLAGLGMEYIHIPVSFAKPTEKDFEQFTDCMEAHKSQKVWVHCAANCRVSAFVYRYRCSVLGEENAVVKKIWMLFGPRWGRGRPLLLHQNKRFSAVFSRWPC